MSKYNVNDWQLALYDQYITFRKRASSCAPTTERTIHSSIFSFFTYMNEHDIPSLADINAMDLKDWHITSEHSSARARNLYTSQLRIFFEYLSDIGMVPAELSLALSCQHAPCTTHVTILSPEQIAVFEAYKEQASTPVQYRDTAVFMLGLKMGMRDVDICNLKLTDISWSQRTISFTQQKTGVYVELPMSVEVGNCLYRYIKEYRPNCQDTAVFISVQKPYRALPNGILGSTATKHIFRSTIHEGKLSFHATRRTFASHMLRAGNTIPIIAATLGHSCLQNIDPYLSTDDEKLIKCAVSCSRIEYSGRYGL